MDNKYKRQEIHSFLDQNTKKDGKKNDQYCYGQLKFGDVQNKVRKISLKTFFGNPEFEIFCIRFDFEDQLIAAGIRIVKQGCSDGTVKIFNIATGKLAFNLQGSSEGSTPTTSIRWRKDGANKVKSVVINVNSDGSIMFWHAQTGKQLHRLVEKNNQILCMDLRLDGEVFATSGRDCKIRIYDEEKKEIIHTFDSADYNQIGHLNRVFALKFLEEFPTTLLSCGWDGNLVIWDLRDKRSVGSIQGPHVSGDSIDVRNGQILTGSYRTNNQLQLWDFGKRSLITNIKWDDVDSDLSYIYSCQFSKINGDTILAGSCGKQEVKLFDINDNYQVCGWIRELQEGVFKSILIGIYCVDYGNKSNKFAFGGGEGVVYICQLNTYK